MVGIYAIANRKADDAFLAALLTVIGYSVMDSIVIFDRIRENSRLMPDVPYDKMVNTSLLQTMTRSVNTLATVRHRARCALLLLRRRYPQEFRVRAARRRHQRCVLVDLHREPAARDLEELRPPQACVRTSRGSGHRERSRHASATLTSSPSRKIPPKQKRPAAPPPRYRRKRQESDNDRMARGGRGWRAHGDRRWRRRRRSRVQQPELR